MAKQTFVPGETNKSASIREAIEAVGPDAPNEAVKQWVTDNWANFGWSTNPAADIAAARKSLNKSGGAPVRRGRRKGAKIQKKVAVRRTKAAAPKAAPAAPAMAASSVARHPLAIALDLLNATSDAEGTIKKARQLAEVAGSHAKALDLLNIL